MRLWDVETGGLLHTLIGGDPLLDSFTRYGDWVDSVSFSPDGQVLASVSAEDATVRLWDVETGGLLHTLIGGDPLLDSFTRYGDWVDSVSFSPDGQVLASVSAEDATVRLWDVETGGLLHTLIGGDPLLDSFTRYGDWVDSVSFSPDGQVLASVSAEDATVRLWDVETGGLLHTLIGGDPLLDSFTRYGDWVDSVSFSPDGQVLASVSAEDATVRLWDVETGGLLHTLTRHTDWALNVSFSPDGRTLASGGADATVCLWDVETGGLLHTLIGHTDWVYSVSFSPDGRTLASGSGDATVRLWDVRTGALLHTLTGHTGPTWGGVWFSPDGQTLVSGGEDATVRLWDVRTGVLLHTLTGHTDWIYSVSFSPDGQTIASVSNDAVFLWDATPFLPSPPQLPEDVNYDGVVNILDLALVASNFGKPAPNVADVNSDGTVDVVDLVLVAAAFGNTAAAPEIRHLNQENLSTSAAVEVWLRQARQINRTDPTFQRGILILEQLLKALTPKETALLPNYPNPFNPETWIPYQLSEASDVTVAIYTVDGRLIRTLALGHQPAGLYQRKNRAAYWDGRNAFGERVASGLYFYTLTAGQFSATGKMLVQK